MAGKVDLRAGIGTAAFERQHGAFTKLGVKHSLLHLEAMVWLLLAHNFYTNSASSARRVSVASS